MGGWIKGELYGAVVSGNRFGLYVDGKSYSNDISVQLNEVENKKIATYVSTSTTVDITTRGRNKLSNGLNKIMFDKDYNNIISADDLIVTVTPIGESNGIHLVSVDKDGFTVKENKNGVSNINFAWIAIASKKGYTKPNNPKEILTNEFNEKLKGHMFNENNKISSAQPMHWDGSKIQYTEAPENYFKGNEKEKNINPKRLKAQPIKEVNQMKVDEDDSPSE